MTYFLAKSKESGVKGAGGIPWKDKSMEIH